jgi:lysophospholipase L1-like esterase
MGIRLGLLGDSIAHGQGASRSGDTLPGRLGTGLGQEGRDVEVRVFAARGARSADLARQVDLAIRWPVEVAVVVIGANDVTHRVSPVAAARALGTAVQRLRRQESEVVVAPAPDLGVVPHVPEELRAIVGEASRRHRRAQAEAVLTAGGRIADADGWAAARFGEDRSLFSADLFHPSSAGYAVIAEALWPQVRAAVEAVAAAREEAG